MTTQAKIGLISLHQPGGKLEISSRDPATGKEWPIRTMNAQGDASETVTLHSGAEIVIREKIDAPQDGGPATSAA